MLIMDPPFHFHLIFIGGGSTLQMKALCWLTNDLFYALIFMLDRMVVGPTFSYQGKVLSVS